MSGAISTQVPEHVDPKVVFGFDIYHENMLKRDLHGGFRSLHRLAPDIFYTPRNGGHWVATRFEDVTHILKDAEHFSNRDLSIPKANSPYVMLPLNLDPPEHTPYRAVLVRYFSPKVVASLDDKLRSWADRLISRVHADGQCDFTEALGAAFPVSIFMEMMGLPMERFDDFRTIVTEYFGQNVPARRMELQAQIFAEMEVVIRARMKKPEDDLISRLISEDVRGRKLTMDELLSMCYLLFVAGLDTVANTLTFTFLHLARDPELQDRLAASPSDIPGFVEEALRSYAIVNPVRVVKADCDYHGASFRVGDSVVCAVPAANHDEAANRCPAHFDIDREKRQLVTFSAGAHLCVGHYLARAEMRVFTEEWLRRVPRFKTADDFKPAYRPGLVMALPHLPLEWTPEQGQ